MGILPSTPNCCSDFCDHLGCGIFGLTLAQNPYSLGASFSHKPIGLLFTKLIFTIDFIDLDVWKHGQ